MYVSLKTVILNNLDSESWQWHDSGITWIVKKETSICNASVI